MAAAICGVGWWAYATEADHIRDRENQELRAIANFKGLQIEEWLAERQLDAKTLIGTSSFRKDFERRLAGQRGENVERLQARLEALRINDSYIGIDLLDGRGEIILSGHAGSHDDDSLSPELLTQAGQGVEPLLIDLHADGDYVDFCYLTPIRAGLARPLLGYLRLCIDPRRRLFPLIQSWPTPSQTAETLLVRREGEEVLFLNDLRHRGNTALKFRLPLGQTDLPSAQAVLGKEGVLAGDDYRDVPVLAYLRPIAGTPWRMVAKIDREEVFWQIGWVARISLYGVWAAIAASGLVLWLLWRKMELRASLAAAEALRQRHEELEALMAAVPSLVLVAHDPEALQISGNQAANRFFGVAEGCSLVEPEKDAVFRARFAEGDDSQAGDLPMRRAAMTGQPVVDHECLVHLQDGSRRWLLGNAVPLFDDGGQPRGCVASYTDITNLKDAEQALERSRTSYRSLFMNMLDAYACCQMRYEKGVPRDFAFLDVNPAFERLTGLRDVVGKSVAEVLPGIRESDPDLFVIAGRVALSGEPEEAEIRIDALDMWVSIAVYSTQHEQFVAIFDNITERKQAELVREIQQTQLEKQVETRTAELLAVNRELQAFTYAASHDLKAPLRGIHSFSTLLERNYRDRLEGDGVVFLDYIRRSAMRMNTLIDDLLAHAQLEQIAIDIQALDPSAAIRAVLGERQEEISRCGADVHVRLPAAKVRAEAHGLLQVLRNLLENALKYSAGSTPPIIEIGGQSGDGRYRLWVRDNGIGFDMAYHDRIFEIFRRLHTYDEYQGSGIGLALVRKAVERMGGRVWAESSPGQGATFYVELLSCTEIGEARVESAL